MTGIEVHNAVVVAGIVCDYDSLDTTLTSTYSHRMLGPPDLVTDNTIQIDRRVQNVHIKRSDS